MLFARRTACFAVAAICRFASLFDDLARGFFDDPRVAPIARDLAEGQHRNTTDGWLAADFERLWSDPARSQRLLDLIRQVEREPDLLGSNPYLLAILSACDKLTEPQPAFSRLEKLHFDTQPDSTVQFK